MFSGELEERRISEFLPNLDVGTELSICFWMVDTPFEYKNYFIRIQLGKSQWVLRFEDPQDDEVNGRMILEISRRQSSATVERTFTATAEVLERMNRVFSATNFSFCLRNSEHMARYIMEGSWLSLQLMRGGAMRKYFEQILKPHHLRLIASLPSDLLAKENLVDTNPLFSGMDMVKFERYVSMEDIKLTSDAYNILIVGPTGAGKSTLTNIFFNAYVSKTRDQNAISVTRTFHMVQGSYRCSDNKQLKVNVVDTMGLCDLFIEDEEAVRNLSEAIFTEQTRIDKVVIVVSETPISTAHSSAIKELLKELSYQDNKDNFVFLFNKTEGLEDDTKLRLLMEIGSELEVDMDHRIPVAMPKPGEGTLETLTFFRAGEAIGTNQADFNDPDSQNTINIVKNNLLPHCKTVLR